jgi:hypothetical protein
MAQLVVKLLVSVVYMYICTYPEIFDTSTQTIKENVIAQPFNYIKKSIDTF